MKSGIVLLGGVVEIDAELEKVGKQHQPGQCPEELLSMNLGQKFLCRVLVLSGLMRNWNRRKT